MTVFDGIEQSFQRLQNGHGSSLDGITVSDCASTDEARRFSGGAIGTARRSATGVCMTGARFGSEIGDQLRRVIADEDRRKISVLAWSVVPLWL
jgi:hypothetical protein